LHALRTSIPVDCITNNLYTDSILDVSTKEIVSNVKSASSEVSQNIGNKTEIQSECLFCEENVQREPFSLAIDHQLHAIEKSKPSYQHPSDFPQVKKLETTSDDPSDSLEQARHILDLSEQLFDDAKHYSDAPVRFSKDFVDGFPVDDEDGTFFRLNMEIPVFFYALSLM
jgi:hypothetical protein